ncbi:MAG: hypothetical protein FWF94_08720 [Oscillospiraceae bacterium]|nr:hypothetical protein [Oscillospiraceae bacterium]
MSGLYRAAIYEGELSESEQPFAVISTALKNNPDLGGEIWDYIFENDKVGDGVALGNIKTNIPKVFL